MKYQLTTAMIFDDFKIANTVFEILKKYQTNFANINVGMDNSEPTFIRLIQTDHDLPIEQRTGSVLLATVDTAKISVLEPTKITNLLAIK